jgi:ATP-dependent Clp protease ATP-binding subunit ClpC
LRRLTGSITIYSQFEKTSQSRDGMFERYSETARRAIHSSRYVAGRVGSPEIETEHLLLGMLRTDKVLARRFLGSPWAAEAVWREIERSKPIREKTPGPRELPLSKASKHVLAFAAEEADLLSNKRVCTDHLLLGLLREEKCFATEILRERGVRLASTREDLMRITHDDSATENFVREHRSLPEDVVELQTRIRSIVSRMEDAIANHDFAKARACSDEEGRERDKLFLLYQQHGLSDWIFD